MQAPREILDVAPGQPPWAARDALRKNCVRLLARREVGFEASVNESLEARDPKTAHPRGARGGVVLPRRASSFRPGVLPRRASGGALSSGVVPRRA